MPNAIRAHLPIGLNEVIQNWNVSGWIRGWSKPIESGKQGTMSLYLWIDRKQRAESSNMVAIPDERKHHLWKTKNALNSEPWLHGRIVSHWWVDQPWLHDMLARTGTIRFRASYLVPLSHECSRTDHTWSTTMTNCEPENIEIVQARDHKGGVCYILQLFVEVENLWSETFVANVLLSVEFEAEWKRRDHSSETTICSIYCEIRMYRICISCFVVRWHH